MRRPARHARRGGGVLRAAGVPGAAGVAAVVWKRRQHQRGQPGAPARERRGAERAPRPRRRAGLPIDGLPIDGPSPRASVVVPALAPRLDDVEVQRRRLQAAAGRELADHAAVDLLPRRLVAAPAASRPRGAPPAPPSGISTSTRRVFRSTRTGRPSSAARGRRRPPLRATRSGSRAWRTCRSGGRRRWSAAR